MATSDPGYNPTTLSGGVGSASLTETSGPTTLTLGSIADGLAVKRVGLELVGYAPGSAALIESGGPTTLTLGAIADGEGVKRVGTNLVGYTPAAGATGATGATGAAGAAGATGATGAAGAAGANTAKYLVQVADGTVANAQAMGALATGITKNTTTTGVQSIAAAGTDYVAPAGTAKVAIDLTGVTADVPLVITTGKNLTGLELKASGSVAVGMLLRDSAGTQGAAVGLARAANDYITTSGAQSGSLANDLVLRSNVGGVHISSFDAAGVRIRGGATYSRMECSDSNGVVLAYNLASMTMTSRSTFVTPIAMEATTSLTNVTLQVAGDVNTGIGPIGGADTLSVVCGGVEQMRVSTTALTLTPKISFFTAQTQATIGANGAAAALTALPLGYMKFDVNGTAVIVPYYNA